VFSNAYPLKTRIGSLRSNTLFTNLRDLGNPMMRAEMSIRRDNRAIAPGADQARRAAALILNLLLISP
jgi:hypothetical protein